MIQELLKKIVQKLDGNLKSIFVLTPTFPFIKLKVGCGTIDFNGSKSTCGSDWYA